MSRTDAILAEPAVRPLSLRRNFSWTLAGNVVYAGWTYREGFGNVALEASAMEKPVVTTRVTGCVDAVVDGVTGTLIPPRDAQALADALARYLRDPDLRRLHGSAGRERVLREFPPERIWRALLVEYRRLLAAKGLGVTP